MCECISLFLAVGCELLYEGVSFGVDLDSRIAVVGPNGAGELLRVCCL